MTAGLQAILHPYDTAHNLYYVKLHILRYKPQRCSRLPGGTDTAVTRPAILTRRVNLVGPDGIQIAVICRSQNVDMVSHQRIGMNRYFMTFNANLLSQR
jgi:hypothetical protein